MRAATQSVGNTKSATGQSGITSAPPKGTQSSKGKETEFSKVPTNDSNKQKYTMLQVVVQAIHLIIDKDKLDKKVKALLEDMLICGR